MNSTTAPRPTSRRDDLHDAVEQYARRGIPVFPLVPGGKDPVIEGGHGFKDATTDQAQIKTWWRTYQDANVGTPVPEQYVVFDVEGEEGHPGKSGDIKTLGNIPRTAIARSGGGGYHVWFKLPKGVDKAPREKYTDLPGIEVRSHGKYMVLPPSIHPSGKPYEWARELGYDLGYEYENVVEIPAHLLDILNGPAHTKPAESRPTPEPTSEPDPIKRAAKWLDEAFSRCNSPGDRDNTTHWLAQQLHWDGTYSEDDADRVVLYYQSQVTTPEDPFTERDALKCRRSAWEQEMRPPASKRPGQEPAAGWGRESAGEIRLDLSSPSSSLDLTSLDFPSCRVEFMRTAEEADMVGTDGLNERKAWPGTPRYERRQAQYKVLHALWAVLAPGDKCPQILMQKWLHRCEEIAPGMECGMVVDCFLAAWENHHQFKQDKDIETPRSYYTNALLHQLDEDFGLKREELRAKIRAAKKEEEEEPAA